MARKQRVRDSVSIALTGSGGSGVMTAGQMLLDAAARAGWYGMMARSSGPQIRGGEAAAFIRLSLEPVTAPPGTFDLMFAFDWMNVERFAAEIPLDGDSAVIGDPAAGAMPEAIAGTPARKVDLPLQELAKEVPGGRPNMVALGVIATLVGLPEERVLSVVEKALEKKGPEAIRASTAAIKAGRKAALALDAQCPLKADGADTLKERWNISGNEAVGLGALRGGVRFVAAYPITPGTEILEWLAPNIEKVDGTLVQAEDELASVNMIIGASFGGVPSLTATAGPGLALMMESIGLAVAAEIPIVVVDVQRGGPSTGIPVKSEQSDLNIALFGLHGDAPHVVTAATSIGDCLFTTQWSVHLAESLQCPVIMLSDQSLGQSRAIIDKPPAAPYAARRETPPDGVENYRRYAVTESGVSPMAVPGIRGGEYVAEGLEHAPSGRPSSQAGDHQAQLDKRQRKLDRFDFGGAWAHVEGEGEIAVVTWGSSTGPAAEAAARLRAEGKKVRLVSLRLLMPAQPERMAKALEGVSQVLVVEQSHSQQFYRYLRAFYDLPGQVSIFAQPGPLPIRPNQVYDHLASWR
ncbi:MAG: 2-oxoacid:acceptor oxidoreductase subunit alpha [Magnetospirillum sp. WYHS-4]